MPFSTPGELEATGQSVLPCIYTAWAHVLALIGADTHIIKHPLVVTSEISTTVHLGFASNDK